MIGWMPWWTWVWPLLAWCVLVAVSAPEMRGAVAIAGEAVVLVATVFAAVWHAEVVAHCIGEPFGTLVLALAVTVIEVALIVSVMLACKAGSETLARDATLLGNNPSYSRDTEWHPRTARHAWPQLAGIDRHPTRGDTDWRRQRTLP
jgi:hypothetical protein